MDDFSDSISTISSQISTQSRSTGNNIRFRYPLAVLCMVGMAAISSVKVTYVMAIEGHNRFSDDTNTEKYDTIIGCSYYCAYSLIALPGGRMGELYSAKWIIFCANTVVIFVHLCTPYLVHLDNLYVIIASRVASGLASGITYPAMIVLVARWSPPAERFILCAIVFGGILFGYSIGVFLTLYIVTTAKWQNAFYLSGAGFTMWLVLHGVYVQDYPEVRKGLATDEVDYISTSLRGVLYDKSEARRSRVPWRGIAKSPPFHALFIVHICSQLVFYVTSQRMIRDSEKYQWADRMNQTGIAALVAAPFFWSAIVGLLIGLAFSTLNHRDAISRPAAIRFVSAVSMSTPAVCLSIDYCVKSDWEMLSKPMIIIMLAGMMNMVQANHIEISPNYAGTLMGITEAFANLTFFIRYTMPLLDHFGLGVVYAVISVCALASMLVFVLFLSTEVQPWNWNSDIQMPTSIVKKRKLMRKFWPFKRRKKVHLSQDEGTDTEEEARENEAKNVSWLDWLGFKNK